MRIHINDKWRIGSDECQWILQKCTGTRTDRRNGGKVPNWKSVGYFPRLAALFNYLISHRIWSDDGKYPPEALDPLTLFLAEIQTEVRATLEVIQTDYRRLAARRDEHADHEIVLCACQGEARPPGGPDTLEAVKDTDLGSPPSQRL